ncbi:hypothetical protein CHUAL_013420 [Chamberlinius hualienensis]
MNLDDISHNYVMAVLKFTDAIASLILSLLVFGFNIKPEKKSLLNQMFTSVFIIVHSLIGLQFCWLSFNQVQFNQGFGKTLNGLILIAFAIKVFLSRLTLHWLLTDMITMIAKFDQLLLKLKGFEQPFLRNIRKIVPIMCSAESINFFFLWTEHYHATIDTNPDMAFWKWPQYQIYGIIYKPIAYVFEGLAIAVILISLSTSVFIFKFLSTAKGPYPQNVSTDRSEVNQIANYLHIHREACQLIRSVNNLLSPILIQWEAMHIMSILFYARATYNSGKIYGVLIFKSTAMIMVLMAEAVFGGTVNYLVTKSLQRMSQLVLSGDVQSMTNEQIECLSVKTELYVTHVMVHRPSLKFGGLIMVTKCGAITIVSFLLTYILFLYSVD